MVILVGIGFGLAILLVSGFIAGRMMSTSDGKRRTIAICILVVAAIIGIVLPLIFLYKTLNVFRLYQEVESAFTNVVGINRYLVNGVLLLLFLPYALLVSWLVSLRSYRRKIARGAILVYLAAFNLSMYFLTKDIIARHDTGELVKWYAMTPAGCQYFDSPGFDPKYGIKLQPLTREARIECDAISKGKACPLSGTDAEYFNPITGEPNYYYQRNDEGELRLYNGPGFDPRTGQKLLPVTSAIVELFETQQRLAELARQTEATRDEAGRQTKAAVRERERIRNDLISNPGIANSPQETEVIVLAATSESECLAYFTRALTSVGFVPISNLFAAGVYGTGCYAALLRGDAACVRQVDLARYADYLLVLSTRSQYSVNKQLFDMRNCHLNVTSIIYDVGGNLLRRDVLLINGVGDYDETAAKAAYERAADSLASIFKSSYAVRK
jgi:hypothetical protein